MKISIFYVSERGRDVAERISTIPDATSYLAPAKGLRDLVSSNWAKSDAIVFIGSTGVAVRVIAPLMKDKETDPCVVVVTEDGKVVIPLTGAHLGGGSDLAREISSLLESELVLTTSSDRAELDSPDLLCSRWNWNLENRTALTRTNGKLIDEKKLLCWIHPDLQTPPFPPCYDLTDLRERADVVVSHVQMDLTENQVQLIPRTISAGTGCRRGTSSEAIVTSLKAAFKEKNFYSCSLKEIVTINHKADEEGLIKTAEKLGVPLVVIPDDEVKSQEGPFSPSAATKHLDLPGVAEPCAASRGELTGPRRAQDCTTVALSISDYDIKGKLSVIGTGPGDSRFMTLEARDCLKKADAVVGYRLYVDQLPQNWLEGKLIQRYGMGQEEARVEAAMDLAIKGYRVALVSGGDPILFGMAGLARNMVKEDVDLQVISGISAVQAAGAFLGAPYSNGLVLISLSDYLQPWEAIEKSLDGAASTGLTVALYNPVKRDLELKLNRVKQAFSFKKDQEAWLITDAGRPGQRVKAGPLCNLNHDDIDMRTMILLPGKDTVKAGSFLVDTRGYKSERKLKA